MNINFTLFLLIICIIFSFTAFYDENMYMYGMGMHFLELSQTQNALIQFFLYSFIHGSFFHLFFNSIVLYYFWNKIENFLHMKYYILFFLIVTLGVAVSLLVFDPFKITVGISGFGMALMSFYTLLLYEARDDEYKWWITFLIINILIWFGTQISLIWHLSWAILWVMFFFFYTKILYKIHQ